MFYFHFPEEKKKLFCFSSCRCIKPQLKSLALGFHALATRTLGKGLLRGSGCLWSLQHILSCFISVENLSFFFFFGLVLCWATAGIPAPIYFGAIIDTTCLKWGQKRCGGLGACRIYNTTAYRFYWHSHRVWACCSCLSQLVCFLNWIFPSHLAPSGWPTWVWLSAFAPSPSSFASLVSFCSVAS